MRMEMSRTHNKHTIHSYNNLSKRKSACFSLGIPARRKDFEIAADTGGNGVNILNRAKHLLYHYISLALGNIEIGDFLLTFTKKKKKKKKRKQFQITSKHQREREKLKRKCKRKKLVYCYECEWLVRCERIMIYSNFLRE